MTPTPCARGRRQTHTLTGKERAGSITAGRTMRPGSITYSVTMNTVIFGSSKQFSPDTVDMSAYDSTVSTLQRIYVLYDVARQPRTFAGSTTQQ